MIENKKGWLLFCVLSIIIFTLKAQTPSYKWEAGFKVKHELSEQSALEFNLLGRETFNEYASENIKPFTDRVEVRGGYYYKLKNKYKVGLAYLYRNNNPFERNSSNENRLMQQISYLSNFVLPIALRLRIEERFFKKEMVLRLRYRFKYIGTFSGSKLEENSLYYTISEELLFSFNKKWSGENRLALGLGYLFKNGSALDVSISNRYKNLIGEKKRNILQFQTFYSFKI